MVFFQPVMFSLVTIIFYQWRHKFWTSRRKKIKSETLYHQSVICMFYNESWSVGTRLLIDCLLMKICGWWKVEQRFYSTLIELVFLGYFVYRGNLFWGNSPGLLFIRQNVPSPRITTPTVLRVRWWTAAADVPSAASSRISTAAAAGLSWARWAGWGRSGPGTKGGPWR